MPLKAVLKGDDHAKLSPDLKAAYKPMGEGSTDYILDVEPDRGFSFENTENLRRTLERQKGEIAKLNDLAKKFEGVDAEQARDALGRVKDMANWTPEQKVKEQMAALERQLRDAHGSEKKALEAKLSELEGLVNTTFVDGELSRVIAASGGSVPLLLPAIRGRVKAVRDGAKFVIRVIDEQGNPLVTRKPDASGDMGLDEFVPSLKNVPGYAPAFAGSGPAGGGTPPVRTPDASAAHTISRADARDHAKWSNAEEAAQKAGKQLAVIDG